MNTKEALTLSEEVMKLIETTARHAAKYGLDFETMMQKAKGDDPQFSFLKPQDPLRSYFDTKVGELKRDLTRQEERIHIKED